MRAFDPGDGAAMRLFRAGFRARRDDGQLVAEACAANSSFWLI